MPPPLGIGTVKLADGGSVNGFICEGWVAGARRLLLLLGPQPHGRRHGCFRSPAWSAPPLNPVADACKAGAANVEDITHLGSWLKYVERQAARQAGQQQ